MTPLQQSYKNKSELILSALKKGNMNGYYAESSEEALSIADALIDDGAVIAWGGSVTLDQIGIKEKLAKRSVTLLDRDTAASREEQKEIYRKSFSADVYLTSTNAITMDGKLVNIDGNGNRVSAMIFGPDKVIVFAGMNKVEYDEDSALIRVRNQAAPPNANRLNLTTPCSVTGLCSDCHSKDCICCHTVITRYCRTKGRIHVILIGENLGY